MDNLILVNKTHSLAHDYIPKDLTYVDVRVDVADEKKFMRYVGAIHLRKMFFDARKEKVDLVGISGFRSYERQKQIYEESLKNRGVEHTEKYIAYPGTSEHQTGLAIDISCEEINNQLEEEFASTKEGKWLANNCYKYGYIIRYPKDYEHITGFNYEPWHIRYVGILHATYMFNNNIKTLEEYIKLIK